VNLRRGSIGTAQRGVVAQRLAGLQVLADARTHGRHQ
jgi:hypothetical protein